MLCDLRTSDCYLLRCIAVRHVSVTKVLLAFWEDGDPDIPTLKEAKAEYAELQSGLGGVTHFLHHFSASRALSCSSHKVLIQTPSRSVPGCPQTSQVRKDVGFP